MTPDEPPVPRRDALLPLLALTLAAAALRLPWLAREGLWFDEVFSVVLASQDVPELVRRALADQTNPPGFYLLLWGWIRLGGFEDGWLRLLPALAGLLTPAAVALLARRLGALPQTALLAGTLAVASPLLLAMSVEVRAYAPLALLATGGLLLAARLAQGAPSDAPAARRTTLLALVLVDAALVALHYFGALAILAQGAFLASEGLDRPGRRALARDLVLASLPALLLLGGWLAAVVAGAGGQLAPNVAWIQPATLASIPRFATHVIGDLGTRLGALLIPCGVAAALAAALLLPARHAARQAAGRRGQGARVAALAALVPIALVLLAEWFTPRALWVPRYLIGSLPPMLVAIALATERLGPWSRDLVASTLAGWSLVAGMHDVRARPQRPPWATIVAELARGAPTTICVNEPFVGLPIEYHALRDRLPVRVLDMRACAPGPGRSWVVYRTGTESSLGAVVQRGARLGPRISLGTDLPPTEARPLDWPRR